MEDPASRPPDPPDHPSAEQLARAAGCSAWAPEDTTELYVRETACCELDGDMLTLYTFTDGEARDNWLAIAQGFGGIFVVGPSWVISADSQEAAERAQEGAGGEIR